jgi:hypothetical protein
MAVYNGTKKKNVVNGDSDDDQIFGHDGNDQLFGNGGADAIVGGKGNDKIDGGTGVDTAVFSGLYADYKITFNADNTVTVKGKDGHDTVVHVEILRFDDRDAIIVGGGGSEFTTIQSGVEAATNGAVVLVAAGTYVEQVTIENKTLTLQGTGDATKIVAPSTLTANIHDAASGTPSKNAIIGVNGGDVTISDILIDGAGHGDGLATTYGAADFNGIYYLNAGGAIDDVTVTGIRDPYNLDGSLSGNQRGNAIVIADRDGVARIIEVSDTTITDFQKTGMVFVGAGLTVDIHDNAVTGGGLQPLGSPAQNGIQVSGGATGVLDNNTINELGYGPDSFSATGILVFGSDGVVVINNVVTMVGDSQDAAVAFIDADNPTATGNSLTASFGVYQLGIFTTSLNHSDNDFDGAIAVGFYPDAGGPFTFTGSEADDDIWGAGANDVLNGGRGDDSLIGDGSHFGFGIGDGDDTFVFQKHSGNDMIWDFGQSTGDRDVIDVSDYHFKNFAELQRHIENDVDGNAVIHLSGHDSVTVVGISAASLTQQDFLI